MGWYVVVEAKPIFVFQAGHALSQKLFAALYHDVTADYSLGCVNLARCTLKWVNVCQLHSIELAPVSHTLTRPPVFPPTHVLYRGLLQ